MLNEFIDKTYHPPGWPEEFENGIRIIDSLDLSRLQSAPEGSSNPMSYSQSFFDETPSFVLETIRCVQTRGAYKESFTSPFLGESPEVLYQTVKSQFPGTKLNCAFFIVLDSITLQNQTCIIADMQILDEDPNLMLVRTDFESAFASIVATTCTSLTFEVIAMDQVRDPSKEPGTRGYQHLEV